MYPYWVRDNGAGEVLRVSISDDNGTSWTEIQNLDNTGQNFSHELINLANVAAENGLTLNDKFRIRFSYGDGYGDVNDGMVIDELRLTQRAPAASFPLADGFEIATFASHKGSILKTPTTGSLNSIPITRRAARKVCLLGLLVNMCKDTHRLR